MTQILPTLTAVRELLTKPSHWTKGFLARDKHGYSVDPIDASAVCWCLVGAIYKVNEDLPLLERTRIKTAIYSRVSRGLMVMNDSLTHPEVLSFLDEQIAKETPSA